MEWRGRRGSDNIEDRRRMAGGKAGLGGIGVIAVLLIGYMLGVDVTPLLENAAPPASSAPAAELTPEEVAAGEFVSVTLADTEEVWRDALKSEMQKTYEAPVLVLYRGATASPCGGASKATGPFYCPFDGKIYLDTGFFTTLSRDLGAKGDFAMAYVVAHEVGHRVQDEIGILGEANKVMAQVAPEKANGISVRLELQADCFAGVWAKAAGERFGSIERGDVEEAANAARRIGDDVLQASAGGEVMPETFTHGTARQRSRWFNLGYQSGRMSICDTFGIENP